MPVEIQSVERCLNRDVAATGEVDRAISDICALRGIARDELLRRFAVTAFRLCREMPYDPKGIDAPRTGNLGASSSGPDLLLPSIRQCFLWLCGLELEEEER